MLRREEIPIPGDRHHTHISGNQTVFNIPFGTAIDQSNRQIPLSPFRHLSSRDFCDQIIIIGIVERDISIEENLTKHGTMLTNMLCEQTRIFDFQSWNLLQL